MRVLTMTATLLASLVVGSFQSAQAQAPLRPGISMNTRPTFSPYLNLARRGQSAALNYYGIVRPELRFANSLNVLQAEVAMNRDLITTGRASTVGEGGLVTGHSAMFLNTGGYFMNLSGRGGTGVGTGAGTVGAVPGRGGMVGGGINRSAAPVGGRGVRR